VEIAKHSVPLTAPLELIWEKMLDWRTWPAWDRGMDFAKFEGPLVPGSSGRLKLKGGPEVALAVTEMKPGQSYKSEFTLWATRFIFGHDLEPAGEKIIVMTFTVDAEGPIAVVVGNLLKPKIAKGLPTWMDGFKKSLSPRK
jgi:hypothetical protein